MEETLDIQLAAARPKVLSMARKFFRASNMQEDPEDVVQDVLLRLWEARREGVHIHSVEAWARTATKNSCISLWRKARRERTQVQLQDLPDEGGASQRIEYSEAFLSARKALGQLPSGTRRLLELKATGLSLDEIAAITDRPKGSVKSSISQARRKLMDTLLEEK